MSALLAIAPIFLLFLLLIGARWPAAWAGVASALAVALVAALDFAYGRSFLDWIGALAEALFLSLAISWIIFGALCIHEFQTRSGAILTFGRWLNSFGDDRRITALFIAWFFALFLEGAAGFGTPVALAAPLLVGLGFSPVRALAMVLVGHAVGVSFGAVGTPIVPLLAAAPLPPSMLALGIALLNAALGWVLAALVFGMAGSGPEKTILPSGRWGWPALAALLFFVPYVVLAGLVGPELPTLGGALVGALLFAFWARWRQKGAANRSAGVPVGELVRSALPYLLVIIFVLASRLIPAVKDAMEQVTLAWSLDQRFSGSIEPLSHPGSLLMLAFLGTGLVRGGGIAEAARCAAARLPMVMLTLFAVLVLARLMVHSGMIDLLAGVAASWFGAAWPLAAPFVGALGSFITGSATASNILFAEFQVATGEAASIANLFALAGQGVGAGIGNIIAPHNIVAGAATVGLVGGEGRVLRQTLPICLAYAAAAGLLLFAVSLLAPGLSLRPGD